MVRDRRQLLADTSLLLAVAVWGITFVMVKDAVTVWPVFTFLALRMWIAGAAFAPLSLARIAFTRGRWLAQLGPG
jgi:drug/metabolite transporter (DMT)-like permease